MAGDLDRAEELMRPGMAAMLGYPAAPPLTFLGLWVLLRAVRGDDAPAATLARRGAGRRRANQAAVAFADAVAAGRSGAVEEAAARFAAGVRIGADAPWWNRLLRMVGLHAALVDGWAGQVDAVGALRADLADHERAGDTSSRAPAATCCAARARRPVAAAARRRCPPRCGHQV